MANVTEITIQAPSDDCILWEYDLTGVKKLKIQETGTRRGVLCECDPRGNITEVRARDVKLDKNKKYRLFGLRNDFAKVFADENEFRVVTGPRVFDWDGLRFQAKLIIIGTLDMSVQNQIRVQTQILIVKCPTGHNVENRSHGIQHHDIQRQIGYGIFSKFSFQPI